MLGAFLFKLTRNRTVTASIIRKEDTTLHEIQRGSSK